MDIKPLRDELDMLDHRRARLQDILDLGLVSEELASHLRRTLEEIDQRIATLCPGGSSAGASYAIFLPPRQKAA